nr:HGGxSTG domain-containing protein [Armatimonas sp.]
MRKPELTPELIEHLRTRLVEAERELTFAQENAQAADRLRAAGVRASTRSLLGMMALLALSGSNARLRKAELDIKTIRKYQRCGAQTRKGKPCPCKPEEGKLRCRYHGGLSRGPVSEAGREAIRESNRRRAQKRREELARQGSSF